MDFIMRDKNYEEKEICTINNKNYYVTTRVTDNKLSKKELINLMVNYGIQELEEKEL